MFITSKLIYLQMQKTGCTHIQKLLAKYVGGIQDGKHNWLTNYNTDKFIAGSIRNPWDWYVSLWAYGCSKRGGLYQRLTHVASWKRIGKNFARRKVREGVNEFRKPIKKWAQLYEDNENPELFQTWLRLVFNPKRSIDLGEDYYASSLSKFAGFMTYRYCKLHLKHFFKRQYFKGISSLHELRRFDETNNLLHGIIHNESLEEDFIKVVQLAGHFLDEAVINLISAEARERTNISQHRDASYYYDAETLDLVAQKEAFLIKKYGYKPPK